MSDSETVAATPPAVGTPAPDFQLESIAGESLSLSSFRDQRVFLWLSRGIF